MKKIFFLTILSALVIVFSFGKLSAQVTIGADVTAKSFSVLELYGQYKTGVFGGLRLPQLSTADRNTLTGLTSDAIGLMILNTDNNCVEYWNGTKWVSLCDGGTGSGTTPGGGDPGTWNGIECGAYIAPGVWKKFMCRNLGADPNADPITPSAGLNGDYYNWGSKTPAATWDAIIIPTPWTTPAGWYGNNSNAEDAKVKSFYDPCPAGYRIPTYAEWEGVFNATLNPRTIIGDMTSADGPDRWSGILFGDKLFLPTAGLIHYDTGALDYRGRYGGYWGSRVSNETSGFGIEFTSTYTLMGYSYRTYGKSIRCIAID